LLAVDGDFFGFWILGFGGLSIARGAFGTRIKRMTRMKRMFFREIGVIRVIRVPKATSQTLKPPFLGILPKILENFERSDVVTELASSATF
jgi:hypothetical protein